MRKLEAMLFALLGEIDKYENVIPEEEKDYPTNFERLHISSCARIGYMFAQERGVDPDLAAAACAMHDYGRIITGRQHDHAEVGYLPAMEFLRGTELFTEEEVQQIGIAVKNHSKKSEVGSPLEEIVKDADCLDFHMYGYEMPREEQKQRLRDMLGEKYNG